MYKNNNEKWIWVLYYPTWRRDYHEFKPLKQPTSINYNLPTTQDYDIIFICRSSCWTPPWFDNEFQEFIQSSNSSIINLESEKLIPRKPASIAEASIIRNQRKTKE